MGFFDFLFKKWNEQELIDLVRSLSLTLQEQNEVICNLAEKVEENRCALLELVRNYNALALNQVSFIRKFRQIHQLPPLPAMRPPTDDESWN